MCGEDGGGKVGFMNGTSWVDAHCHLHLLGEKQDAIRSRCAGWRGWMVNAVTEEDWGLLEEWTINDARIVPCFGIHPWEVDDAGTGWEERLVAQLNRLPQAQVGETGLDRTRNGGGWERQVALFRSHLSVAHRLGRKIVIHGVRAEDRLREVVEDMGVPEAGILLHAWQGSAESARWWVKRGAYFSFNRQHCRSARAQEAFRQIPVDRLLVETDMAGPEFLPMFYDGVGRLGSSRP